MSYILDPGTYEAVLWDSTDEEGTANEIAGYYDFEVDVREILGDGSLHIEANDFTVTIPPDHYMVMGPNYGTYKSGNAILVDATTFEIQYNEVV